MRIDAQALRVLIGVRELAYGGQPKLRGPAAMLRAELGRRAHERYAEERAGEALGVVEGELPVSIERQIGSWCVALRGRCDVFVPQRSSGVGDGGVVEEVKSVVDDLETRRDEELASACRQARLYALCIDQARTSRSDAITARVVLVSLGDGSRRLIDAGYRRDDTEAELGQLLLELIASVEAQTARAELRRATADRLAFPHPALRMYQGELIDTIDGALGAGRPVLAQAPTGIGKTVSAMLPALRHALRQDATVFYLTAKTTQRAHVAATFEDIAATVPDVPLSAITLRRKEHMCPPGDLRCHPDACPLLARFDERSVAVVEELAAEGALSPERIFARGAETTLCPYELSIELASRVDVVIGDFNHVFDASMQDALGTRRRVVVVDEAHNLFDRARGYESPFVGLRALRAAEEVLADEPLDDALRTVSSSLRQLIDRSLEKSDDSVRRVMDDCAPQEIDGGLTPLANEAALLAMRWSHRRWQRREISRCDPVLDLAGALMKLSELSRRRDDALVGYVAGDDAPAGRGIGIVCVDPSRSLEAVHRRAAGTIAMSATLSPLEYFNDVLGLARLDPVLSCAPSPFPREHREIVIVPTVSTTFRERDAHAPEIARLIEKIVSVKPGRYIAYFTSYSFLGRVQSLLTLPRRSVLTQLPGSAPAVRSLLLRQLTQSGDEPRLLLAVMGGIYGEGIDLPGDALIGVIVVGPGLPALSFERHAMRHHYDATREAGFAYAMVYPGLQRVIQAAGRVIRTEEDRGVIALLGRRFAEPDYTACLPEDWYRYDPTELFADDPAPRLEAFWDQFDGVGGKGLLSRVS